MADSRKEYLQSLNRMRNNYQNQGNVLINNEDDNGNVGNELSAFAYMNTDVSNPNYFDRVSKGVKGSAVGKAFGSIDEMAGEFGSGFVNGWEGILDYGANFLGWLTGSDNFNKWAQQDIGRELADYTMTYANLTPWSLASNGFQGNYYKADWWGNAIGGLGDILTSATGGWDENQIAQGILTGGVSTLLAGIGSLFTWWGNKIGGTEKTIDAYIDDKYSEHADQYYGFDNNTVKNTKIGNFEVGNFAGGIVHSIGEMLPSIMIGNAVGGAMTAQGAGAKAVQLVSKGASTAFMGLSSAGHASNEALQDGASKGKALGYGAVSGAIEAGTEWIFPDGGVGGSNVGKSLKKSVIRELGKEMLEEGVEEVVSELLNPVAKMIYDKEAYKEYTTGEYWQGVALAGASGAISGGIMSTISGVHNKSRYGQATTVAENVEAISDLAEQYKKAKTDAQRNQIQNKIDELNTENMNILKEMANSDSPKVQRQLANFLESVFSKNARVSKQTDALHTVTNKDVERINTTKFENEDGSARRYEFADIPNELGGWTVTPSTKKDGSDFFVYSKNPLRETNIKNELAFDKVSQKFNIPSSLEKTYSKKLNAKNPMDVLEYISRYAKTDAQGVLTKLGYDAFEYKNGNVIINNGQQFIKGDLRYGERKGNNDYSSLIKRFGRQSSYEELQRYVGKNGRELETPEERQAYSEAIIDNRAYTNETAYGDPVKVISKSAYSKDMIEIAEYNKKLGAETKFILREQGTQFELTAGFYNNNGTIYLVLNATNENRTLKVRNQHELFHYLDDVYYARGISNLNDLFDEWKNNNADEFDELWNLYVKAYKDKYDTNSPEFEDLMRGELLAEIYSGDIEIEDKLQKAIVDTVDKVIQLGKTKAQKMFYQSVENDDFKPIKIKYTLEEPNIREKNTVSKPNGASLGLAITYDLTSEDISTISSNVEKYKAIAFKRTKKIAKIFGLDITQKGAIGGWTWTDNADIVGLGGEPSFPVVVNNYKNFEDVKLFASVMGDLGYEVQNTVGLFQYDENGKDYEDVIQLKKIDNRLFEILKSVQLDGFNIDEKTKILTLDGISDDKIEALEKALKGEDYYESWQSTKCNVEWLGLEERSLLYKSWLKTHSSSENGNTYRAVKQASKINQYIIDNSTRNEDGYLVRNEGTLSNSSEILKELKKTPKIISDIKAQSSTSLIEAGADVSKNAKHRIDSVRQAFDNALNEVVPENGKYKIEFSDVKQTYAELNLAKPKDRAIAVDNMIKRLKEAKVTLVDVFGEEKFELGDILSEEDEAKAREIMIETLNGNAEPTKLTEWAKRYNLAKLKGRQNIETIKLVNRINRKITNAVKEYVNAPNVSTGELTIYKTLVAGVKAPLNNQSIKTLCANIATQYTEENIGSKLAGFGIFTNKLIQVMSAQLNDSIVVGRPLTVNQLQMANSILSMIYDDIKNLGVAVKNSNVEKARGNIVLAQALTKTAPKSRVGNALRHLDYSTRSPINILVNELGDSDIVKHLRDGGKECSNNQTAVVRDMQEPFKTTYLEQSGLKSTSKLNDKIEIANTKMTKGVALSLLNTITTVGQENVIKYGFVIEDRNGNKSKVIRITEADIATAKELVGEDLLAYNELIMSDFFNDKAHKYLKEKLHKICGITLPESENPYYPTARNGDKQSDVNVVHSGSLDPQTWGLSILQERKGSALPYLIKPLDVTVNSYIYNVTRWGEWAEWYKALKVMENTRVFGVTFTQIMREKLGSTAYDKVMDFIHRTVLGIPFDNKATLLGRGFDSIFGNLQKVAMLDPFTQIKTLGSLATLNQFFGIDIAVKGQLQYLKNGGALADKKNRAIIEKYSPTLQERFKSNIAFSANISKEVKGKIGGALSVIVRTLDMHIHVGEAFAMAQVQAQQEGFGNPYSETNNERAVRILEQVSDTTQPTTSKFNVGMYRAGANGVLVKRLFGMFSSMGQNIYQGLYDVTVGWRDGVKRIDALAQALKHEQERLDFYKNAETEARERMDSAETQEDYNKAQEDYENARYKQEEHLESLNTINEQLKLHKEKYTIKNFLKKIAGYLAGLIGSGLILTLIAELKKKSYGRKEWNDWKLEDLTQEAIWQSFVNWIPYVGTIANSIKNDTDLTPFTMSNVNDVIGAFETMVKGMKEGDGGKVTGGTIKALYKLSAFFGIPAESLWNILNGVWYNIDHASNIAFKDWLGMYSANYLRTNYSEAVKGKQHDKAVSNMEVWLYNYSIQSSKENIEEMYRLNTNGIQGVTPSAIPTYYLDEKGEKIYYSNVQVNAFRNVYKGADKDALALVKSDSYKTLDDEYKGKALKKVYTAYYEVAKAKAYNNTVPTGKLAKLLYFTNGDVQLAKYVSGMQNLADVKEDKLHTRKQNVLTAINKMSGFNRQEKLLLAYLSGYSVSDANKNNLVVFLMSKGFTKKEATEYLQ